jgi:hypothetical protein
MKFLTGLFTLTVLLAALPARAETPPELRDKPYLFEVARHLYRWYMDEIDAQRAAGDETFAFWVRGIDAVLDPGDKSRLGEVVLPTFGILVQVKMADYTIEELNLTVKNDRFKIVNVARAGVPAERLAVYEEITVNYAEMRDYLFKTRSQAKFPEGDLLRGLRLAVREALADELEDLERKLPDPRQTVHFSALSPVANELWVFWEDGRRLIRFASDLDLANPALWGHTDLAVKIFDLDEQVVVSLDEVAGSNAYLTRDQVGRALFNCIVLGQKMILDRRDLEEARDR